MHTNSLVVALSLLLSLPPAAQAQGTSQQRFIRSLDDMMVALAPQNARASKTIRHAYRDHLDLLVLDRLSDVQLALANGGLAPLPSYPLRFNLAPRLTGSYPIGEKDMANQASYIAGRPATIGCLLDVASRVTSGPLEITSLVRHSEYQGALSATNANATTAVPMHTMGLAFDIALVNTPLETVYEIRDVLERMRDAGDLLFIGERRQLVFHVVPHPSRLGHFTDVYTRMFGAPPADAAAQVAEVSPARGGERVTGVPAVRSEVIAVLPADEFADEWWAADHAHADVTIDVWPDPSPLVEPVSVPTPIGASVAAGAAAPRLLAILAALMAIVWRFVTRRPHVSGLQLQAHPFESAPQPRA